MHLLKIRCPDCGKTFSVRRPTDTLLIVKIIPLLICPICKPEQSENVCGGCRLPFAIVGKHSKHLCRACFWKDWRYNKIEKYIIDQVNLKPEADSGLAST